MTYRDIERRLAELERRAPPIVPEPDEAAAILADWEWAAKELAGYVSMRGGYRYLPNTGTDAWNRDNARWAQRDGYREDEMPAAIVADVEQMVADGHEADIRALPPGVQVLDLLPQARAYLEMDGQYV